MPKPLPEKMVKKLCQYILSTCGFAHFHIQQGALSYPGISDHIAIRDGLVLFIEFKAEKSGRLGPKQVAFMYMMRNQGGKYLVIRHPDILLEELIMLGIEKAKSIQPLGRSV